MIERDVDAAVAQFSDDATWINSQGYFFEGLDSVRGFHRMLAENDTTTYTYVAGEPRIRVLDDANALAYYPWRMVWVRRDAPADTVMDEVGLMTLSARKHTEGWRWVAVTNQHTPWFYDTIEPVE